jgi:ubiquitin-protein ligase E3 D
MSAHEQDDPTDSPFIQLYAEYLLHIRSLALTAALLTESSPLTRAFLSADGSSLSITHENASATIVLPTKIDSGGKAELQLPEKAAKELQLRLKLEKDDKGFLEKGLRGSDADEGNAVPWSAVEFEKRSNHGYLQCVACDERFVNIDVSGKQSVLKNENPREDDAEDTEKHTATCIDEFKDLPNENWAEMMDFWHCHKPPNNSENGANSTKSYSASNKIKSLRGAGLVDLGSFLFHENDCTNIKVSEPFYYASGFHNRSIPGLAKSIKGFTSALHNSRYTLGFSYCMGVKWSSL